QPFVAYATKGCTDRFMVPRRVKLGVESAHEPRRNSRQVLECGDGVRAVTALARAALELLRLTADTHNPTQSGDSADSVAAVQDASRPDWIRPRFMVPMCVHLLELDPAHEPERRPPARRGAAAILKRAVPEAGVPRL